MGIDRVERARKPDKFQLKGSRFWVPHDVVQGAAYASVSFSAQALLVALAAQLRAKHGEIINNGDLTTAFSVLSQRGWKDEKTIRKAARQLEAVSLIVKTRQGHRPNTANLYAVTWLPLNENDKLDITARGFPLNRYLLMDKPPAIKSISDGEIIPIKPDHSGKNSLSTPAETGLDREKIPLSGELEAA